jgi:hypothetical protein
MHGLILRTVQRFVTDLYGSSRWQAVIKKADLDFDNFESMLEYSESEAKSLLKGLEASFEQPLEELFEDLGTYLISHPSNETVRRLLRFSGVNFEDFLFAIDDLPGRVRLAIPDLDLPHLDLRAYASGTFSLSIYSAMPGFGHALVGLMRTMADDYGALVMVEYTGSNQGCETLEIKLLESTFADGRSFDLTSAAVGG